MYKLPAFMWNLISRTRIHLEVLTAMPLICYINPK